MRLKKIQKQSQVNLVLTVEECTRVVNFVALLAQIDKRMAADNKKKKIKPTTDRGKIKVHLKCHGKARCLCGSCYYLPFFYAGFNNSYNQPRATQHDRHHSTHSQQKHVPHY